MNPSSSRLIRLLGFPAAALLTLAASTGCGGPDEVRAESPGPPARSLIGTEWLLTGPPETTADAATLQRLQATLTFTDDGTVSGSGGCNRLTGQAEVDGDTVIFGPIASTRMACDPVAERVERQVFSVLDGAVDYRIEGDRLELARDTARLEYTAQT